MRRVKLLLIICVWRKNKKTFITPLVLQKKIFLICGGKTMQLKSNNSSICPILAENGVFNRRVLNFDREPFSIVFRAHDHFSTSVLNSIFDVLFSPLHHSSFRRLLGSWVFQAFSRMQMLFRFSKRWPVKSKQLSRNWSTIGRCKKKNFFLPKLHSHLASQWKNLKWVRPLMWFFSLRQIQE